MIYSMEPRKKIDPKEVDIKISRLCVELMTHINLSRLLKGKKDSSVYIMYEPSSQKLEIGGLNSGESSVQLEVTPW